MALFRCMGNGSGSGGGGLVNTVKLLTSSQALSSVTYTFPAAYNFVRVRIKRNSTTVQQNPVIKTKIPNVDTDNIVNDPSTGATVSASTAISLCYHNVTAGSVITIWRANSGSGGEGARYSEFDVDMYN